MIQIDHDIPPPKPTIGRPLKYPFPDMGVGDSFAIPLAGVSYGTEDHAAAKLRAAAIRYGHKNGCKFSLRTDRENNVVRCWRVE